jgi:FPC/CPF motif-containing protein YcgG
MHIGITFLLRRAMIMKLFDKPLLTEYIRTNRLPSWAIERYETFRETMLNPDNPYPCHFAVNAEAGGFARYIFCDSPADREALIDLRDTLYQYIRTYESIEKRTTCVIFFKPPETTSSEQTYRNQFWQVLQFLHDHDLQRWPEAVPTDPEDATWEYCFGGEPMFIVGRAPFYEKRRSRYTPHGLEITIQPRGTLNDITGDTEAGQQARTKIRQRLKEYDDVPLHPDMGDYGDADSREWKQYFLPEDPTNSIETCPLEIKREQPPLV